MWLILALLSAIFAALVAIFGKLGLKTIDTTLATTLRAIIMVFVLIPTTLLLGKMKFEALGKISIKDWWLLIAAGLAGALSWLCYFAALKTGKASSVAALDRLSIVFVIIFASMFLGENFSLKTAVGAILIASGAIFLILK